MSYGHPAAESPSQVPVCPRHPDRTSYVRCQRCGRPACTECQRAAAVGFQCIDCVNEAQKRIPAVRSVYGGAVATGRPLVTYSIIALCVVVYALQLLIPGNVVFSAGAFNPAFLDPNLGQFEPWRTITSAFLHSPGSFLHIILNMYTLWIFGQALEPLLGRVRFLALYLVSAIGGSVGYLLLTSLYLPGQQLTGVVGASGAIFGLFGAMLVIQRNRGGQTRQLWVLIGINAVVGFLIPNIAWQAHLGGLVTGAVCAAIIAYAPRGSRQGTLQGLGLVLVLAVLVLLSVIKVAVG